MTFMLQKAISFLYVIIAFVSFMAFSLIFGKVEDDNWGPIFKISFQITTVQVTSHFKTMKRITLLIHELLLL